MISKYTEILEQSNIMTEMKSAKNFRQTVAKFGPLLGMPLSVLGRFLPNGEFVFLGRGVCAQLRMADDFSGSAGNL